MLPTRNRPGGFTLIELLVVMAIIGVLSSILVPVISQARREANNVQCVNNLKGIYSFAMLYADRNDRAYPVAPGKASAAHLSIQTLVDAFPLDFEPELFVCPQGDQVTAETNADERFVLDAETSSYTWVGRRMKITSRRKALSSDKYVEDADHGGHSGGMNVVTTDGSVKFWPLERLDEATGLPSGLVR